MSAATASPFVASRSTTTTWAPSAARRRLVASPIPDAPPVTRAEVFSSDIAAQSTRSDAVVGQNAAVPLVSYPRRLADLAAADPSRPAVTDEHRTVTRAELEQLATDTAEAFAALGVGPGDIVVLALPNCVEFLAAMIASWKVGATPTPVSSRLPKRELDGIIELAAPALIVGVDPAEHPRSKCVPRGWSPEPAPPGAGEARLDTVSDPWKGMTSGGSTGRPKLILNTAPALIDPDAKPLLMMTPNGTLMMPGPLYHNGPFMWSVTGLLAGNHVVLGGKFDAERTLGADRSSRSGDDVRRSHDDGADLEAPGASAGAVRRVVVEGGLASRRAVSAVAQADVDRLARPRGDLGAVRRNRSAGVDHHQRRRLARAPRLGRASALRRDEGRACRRDRRRSGRDRRDLHASEGPERFDLQLRRRRPRSRSTAVGSRSATWARSTPTATCTSRIGRPT